MNDNGLLIVISGPSGAGKGTICEALMRTNNFSLSVSATTRAPRVGESHGKSYYFIDREEFKKKIEQNDFLEYAEVYGNYYGTLKSDVCKKIESGNDVILEIDIQVIGLFCEYGAVIEISQDRCNMTRVGLQFPVLPDGERRERNRQHQRDDKNNNHQFHKGKPVMTDPSC